MAVQYVKEKNNLLGTLGGLATLAGGLTGQGWLSALGTGLGAINGAMNGDNSGGNSGSGSLKDILENLGKTLGGWFKPTDGNIAKVKPDISGSYANAASQAIDAVHQSRTPSYMNVLTQTIDAINGASNPYAGIGEAIFNVANQASATPLTNTRNNALRYLHGGF